MLEKKRCSRLFCVMKWLRSFLLLSVFLSLLCRGDSQTAAFLNLQPAFRLTALLIIHYKLHTRDAGVCRSVIVTWRITLGSLFPTEAHALQAGSVVSSWRKILFALYIFYMLTWLNRSIPSNDYWINYFKNTPWSFPQLIEMCGRTCQRSKVNARCAAAVVIMQLSRLLIQVCVCVYTCVRECVRFTAGCKVNVELHH